MNTIIITICHFIQHYSLFLSSWLLWIFIMVHNRRRHRGCFVWDGFNSKNLLEVFVVMIIFIGSLIERSNRWTQCRDSIMYLQCTLSHTHTNWLVWPLAIPTHPLPITVMNLSYHPVKKSYVTLSKVWIVQMPWVYFRCCQKFEWLLDLNTSCKSWLSQRCLTFGWRRMNNKLSIMIMLVFIPFRFLLAINSHTSNLKQRTVVNRTDQKVDSKLHWLAVERIEGQDITSKIIT